MSAHPSLRGGTRGAAPIGHHACIPARRCATGYGQAHRDVGARRSGRHQRCRTMSSVSDAFYLPDGRPRRVPRDTGTEGPWEPQTQHAGPPSALLTRAIERLPSTIPGASQLTRLTMEILGPIRTGEVRVTRPMLPGPDGRSNSSRPSWSRRTGSRCAPGPGGSVPPPSTCRRMPPAPTAPPIPTRRRRFRNPEWRTATWARSTSISCTGTSRSRAGRGVDAAAVSARGRRGADADAATHGRGRLRQRTEQSCSTSTSGGSSTPS